MNKLIFITMTILAGATTITAQTTAENKKIIRDGFDRWAKGQGSFFDLLTDDVKWTINGSAPLSKTYTSKQQFLDEVINPLNLRLSKKIVPAVRNLYAEGDVVIALIDGKATATDGKPYNMSYGWFMTMKNGKIVQVDAFLDAIQFADIMQRIPAGK
ncbi:MAG: nuclear transport factor 2 family protein [Flavitalea sp.]